MQDTESPGIEALVVDPSYPQLVYTRTSYLQV